MQYFRIFISIIVLGVIALLYRLLFANTNHALSHIALVLGATFIICGVGGLLATRIRGKSPA